MNIVTEKENFKSKEEMVAGKVVRNLNIARQLLRVGGENVRVIDIKIDRYNPGRCVFVFRDDETFQKYFTQILNENRERRKNFNYEKMYEELRELRKQLAEKE